MYVCSVAYYLLPRHPPGCSLRGGLSFCLLRGMATSWGSEAKRRGNKRKKKKRLKKGGGMVLRHSVLAWMRCVLGMCHGGGVGGWNYGLWAGAF